LAKERNWLLLQLLRVADVAVDDAVESQTWAETREFKALNDVQHWMAAERMGLDKS
jgi:hypothetical protein